MSRSLAKPIFVQFLILDQNSCPDRSNSRAPPGLNCSSNSNHYAACEIICQDHSNIVGGLRDESCGQFQSLESTRHHLFRQLRFLDSLQNLLSGQSQLFINTKHQLFRQFLLIDSLWNQFSEQL